jgi:hypothetical protein
MGIPAGWDFMTDAQRQKWLATEQRRRIKRQPYVIGFVIAIIFLPLLGVCIAGFIYGK